MAEIPDEVLEAVAQMLWHRFAPDHYVEWPCTHADEYRLAAAEALRLLSAATRQLEATAAEPVVNGGWLPIETYNGEWPIRIRAPELVDPDFNVSGETDACALCDPQWYAAKWDNSQDYFDTIEVTPTHWMPTPPPKEPPHG